MAVQNFVDYVKLMCRTGAGGGGSIHFMADRINPRGGPDGGNGGRGGHIILKGNKQLWTLLHLKYRKHIIAGPGESGRASTSTGAFGKDMILEVPLGTVVRDFETGEVEFEVNEEGEERILLKGGRGGKGNAFFKSATNQSPKISQQGEPGLSEWKVLELKLLADVGLVGFPNAGKSTLLSVVSEAKPKIANYAFTTLVPNLGIVKYRDSRSFVMADIPGIIEGAHEGKGLGVRFLRHIERNAALLFMIPCDTDDILEEYKTLVRELEMYNSELLDKPRVIAITKADLIDDELKQMLISDLPNDLDTIFISSVAGIGITELKDVLWKVISENRH